MGSITVTHVGKAYKIYPGRFARLIEWLMPFTKPRHSVKWVLQDINFTVNAGDAIGIIGVNGAGKSTLLKMLTGTTQPTTGSIKTQGRVAALLELGIGFHPEFTGRQNAVMAGQLLGLSLDEVQQLMPQIESFADIGDYIDHPVRVYSSGMQMRLAFAVATAKRPDILIVDEALSVGDTYFQHKSFERIRQFRKEGTTLLIVSHDRQAIQAICDRAILLNAGKLAMEGEPEAVMDYYNALLANTRTKPIRQERLDGGKTRIVSGSSAVEVSEIALLDAQGHSTEVIDVGTTVTLKVVVSAKDPVERLVLGFGIRDRLGQMMYGTNTELTKQVIEQVAAGDRKEFRITFAANLGVGSYSIVTALMAHASNVESRFEWKDRALMFEVANNSKTEFIGCLWMEPRIEISTT